MVKIDFETHFITRDYVRAMEENNGYPRYIINKQTGSRRLYYADDVGEPLGDTLLNKLVDTGDEEYWPVLEKAERLDVPIYLHPTVPFMPQMRKYGNE